MNKNAIIVYINDSDKALTEFSWLYKTWLMWSIDKSWDIVAFANPSIIEDFKSKFHHENLKVIEMLSSDTPIANPYAMFKDDNNIEMLKGYGFLFRTECDSFLTKHFADFKPWRDKVYVGIGLHAATTHPGDLIREKLKIISSTLGLKWYGHSHIGHNLLASSEMVIANSILQTGLTKWLLENSFTNGDGAYPSWFKGEVSQYAHELVINSNVSPLGMHQGSIDTWCGSNEITSLDLHIRAWQQEQADIFNKAKYHAGELPNVKFGFIPKTAGEYCLLVANENVEYLKELAQKNK